MDAVCGVILAIAIILYVCAVVAALAVTIITVKQPAVVVLFWMDANVVSVHFKHIVNAAPKAFLNA